MAFGGAFALVAIVNTETHLAPGTGIQRWRRLQQDRVRFSDASAFSMGQDRYHEDGAESGFHPADKSSVK